MEQLTQIWNQAPLTLQQSNPGDFCQLSQLEGGVYILSFTGEFQHKLTLEAIRLIDKLLDQFVRIDVTADVCACALITANQGKFFSSGMDVNYLKECHRQEAIEYLLLFQRLVSKLLTFCIPTIAIISGHAVEAVCKLSLARDYRLMSTSHGYIFMNEVDLGMSLAPGNMAVLHSKLPMSTFQEAVLTGKRYNGKAAAAGRIVHAAFPPSILLQKGIRKAMEYKARNWKRKTYQALNMETYKATIQELENG
ncbi:enoyl-CoA delta isomerase 2, peroxisomal-like [Mangifera indica]|uniref:enoyl-CoA delta isomerase 2, peroxisomal-like n=1 Tax=Mangifera indica TaxID=29780 RepID=UPI001CFAB912|nr:enoyl-CoA delta isomerase 2, peroxisomal-like [Mangifera indica]